MYIQLTYVPYFKSKVCEISIYVVQNITSLFDDNTIFF